MQSVSFRLTSIWTSADNMLQVHRVKPQFAESRTHKMQSDPLTASDQRAGAGKIICLPLHSVYKFNKIHNKYSSPRSRVSSAYFHRNCRGQQLKLQIHSLKKKKNGFPFSLLFFFHFVFFFSSSRNLGWFYEKGTFPVAPSFTVH